MFFKCHCNMWKFVTILTVKNGYNEYDRITRIHCDFSKATFYNFCKITVDHHHSSISIIIWNAHTQWYCNKSRKRMLHLVHLATIVKIKFLLFYFHFISFIKCHTFSPIFTMELHSLHRRTLTIIILIFTHRASHELSIEPLNFTLSSSSPSNFTDLHPQYCSNFTVVDPWNFTITYLEHR